MHEIDKMHFNETLAEINRKCSWIRMHLDAWGYRGCKITVNKEGCIVLEEKVLHSLSESDMSVIAPYLV